MPTDINTITAWCVIISTIISALTGFFIVQTFQLQAKVATEQSKLTKLEFERNMMEKRPLFFARSLPNTTTESGENVIYKFEIELMRNDITTYNSKMTPSKDLLDLGLKMLYKPLETISVGLVEGTKLNIWYTLDQTLLAKYYDKKTDGAGPLSITVEIKFKDGRGIEYEQKIGIVNNMEPIALPPTLTH